MKKFALSKRTAIALSVLIITTGFLLIAQLYFTYGEVRALSDSCYDRGGFPSIEKSGLRIISFDCDLDS